MSGSKVGGYGRRGRVGEGGRKRGRERGGEGEEEREREHKYSVL